MGVKSDLNLVHWEAEAGTHLPTVEMVELLT